ncbi:MAG: TonB-dependent receptor [Rhodocyclaceae bacterium]|nr:TonB-dependent receptor [Rhodocyclaceae bacterium]
MKHRAIPAALAVLLAGPALAQSDLATMSLEDLSRMEVTTVSRKVQKLADTPAAVTILTAEDIARSGARSLAEALRHVPGLQAAQIGSGSWAVSVRGFNSRFSNKLLVQIDGRTVYTPFFAGVFWDAQNVIMEDIERIEVVRGPGASLWGANAVNGVINIVTRSAGATLGTLASFDVDDAGSLELAARQGFGRHDGVAGRVYAKNIHRSSFEDLSGNDLENEQHGWAAGFRVDVPTDVAGSWTVQGDAYRVDAPEQLEFASGPVGFSYMTPLGFEYEGGNVQVSGRWAVGEGEAQVRAYVDHLSAGVAGEARGILNTTDVDFQHRLAALGDHELIWGAGARSIAFDLDEAAPVLTFSPDYGTESVISAFLQDEITLQPKRWKLTLGTRVERNSLADTEWQPNIRLLWTPTDQDSIWAHVSRASRTPSLGEQYAQIIFGVMALPAPFQPAPCVAAGVTCGAAILSAPSDQMLDAERLTAFELGVRRQIGAGSIEAVAYRHEFKDLLVNELGNFSVPGSLGFPVVADQYLYRLNGGRAHVLGLEFSFEMPVSPELRLSGAWSVQNADSGDGLTDGSSDVVASLPHQLANLRAAIDLPRKQDVDIMWRYVGALGAGRFGDPIPSYQAIDMNYRWRATEHFELSFYVQNLFDDSHPEFASDFFPNAQGYAPRRAFLKGTLRF